VNLCSYSHLRMISLTASLLFFLLPRCRALDAAIAAPTAPNTAQIVQAIGRHDKTQGKALEHYHAVRHYSVQYHGFFKHITAAMDVELDYDATSGKTFHIISQSGSHILCDKVLKRALDSEKDASQDHGAHALSQVNYKFTLLGMGDVNGRPSYIFQVEPLTGSPYLYRGKIWVDSTDYAVSKMEVRPAKNPSFWISRTMIHQNSSRVDGFWLPQQVRSETKVRIGGTAVMTIDYGPYQILQVQSTQTHQETGAQPANAAPRVPVR
jgi:hypothetical protein